MSSRYRIFFIEVPYDFNDLRTLQDVFHRFKTRSAGKLKQAEVAAFPETPLR